MYEDKIMAGGQILSKSFELKPSGLESRNSQILTLGCWILKMAKQKNAISPTREEDYPEWYQQVVRACLLYTSPSPRDATLSRMPSSA